MNSFTQDIRFGLRILFRTPGVTAVVILALALGIGANSAMFSVVDAMLLHPVSYEDPSSLVIVWDRDPQGELRNTSAANLLEWRRAKSFSGMAGWASSTYVLTGLEQPVQLRGARVTGNLFDVLGAKPYLGRTFLRGEDGLDGGGGPTKLAVISFGMWQDALASDPNVLGRTIYLNDTPYAVIGVMPKGFQLLNARHQVWVPAELDPSNRDYHYLTVLARRRVPLAEAAGEMSAISRSLAEAYPGSNRGRMAQVDDFTGWLVNRRMRTRLLLLFAAVGLVLLLACSNVASLLLARSATRTREMALRVSLGATRGRIVAQLLIESVVLALAGGLGGLALAALLIQAAPSLVPASAIPTTAEIQLDWLVVAFTLGLSVVTGVVFGLAPAWAASRPDVRETLQDASRGSTSGGSRQIFRQAMVTLEVAVALMLLASATLMVQSLQRLAGAKVGVDVERVLALRVFLPVARYDAERSLRFHRQALEQVAALPGVASAGLGSNLPLARLSMQIPFDVETTPPRPMVEMPGAGYVSASPGYFRALGIPLRQGRDFEESDNENAPLVAIVNDVFARRYVPAGSPVGVRLRINQPVLGTNDFGATVYVQIVGVVGNVTLEEIGGPPLPMLYAPLAQNVWSTATWVLVKTAADPAGLAAAVRDTVSAIDPAQPIDQMSSMQEIFSTQFEEPRFQSGLMGAFAALALVLAVVGIYGVNAYAVAQRRREIGVRMALGATPGIVIRDLVRQGMKLTGAGLVIGLAGAVGLGSVLRGVLVEVSAADPLPLLGATLFLAGAAAVACYIPARRATHIDPAITLRED